jgi:hypothetical protein
VHISVALRVTTLVSGNLAGKDVAEDGEGVGQTLVVHTGGKVSHEHIANTRLTETGVSLGPHDTARALLDISEVHGIQGALSVVDVVKVDVSVTQRSSGHLMNKIDREKYT